MAVHSSSIRNVEEQRHSFLIRFSPCSRFDAYYSKLSHQRQYIRTRISMETSVATSSRPCATTSCHKLTTNNTCCHWARRWWSQERHIGFACRWSFTKVPGILGNPASLIIALRVCCCHFTFPNLRIRWCCCHYAPFSKCVKCLMTGRINITSFFLGLFWEG